MKFAMLELSQQCRSKEFKDMTFHRKFYELGSLIGWVFNQE